MDSPQLGSRFTQLAIKWDGSYYVDDRATRVRAGRRACSRGGRSSPGLPALDSRPRRARTRRRADLRGEPARVPRRARRAVPARSPSRERSRAAGLARVVARAVPGVVRVLDDVSRRRSSWPRRSGRSCWSRTISTSSPGCSRPPPPSCARTGSSSRSRWCSRCERWRRAVLVAGPAVVVVAAWCWYCYDRTGDAFVFLTTKARWAGDQRGRSLRRARQAVGASPRPARARRHRRDRAATHAESPVPGSCSPRCRCCRRCSRAWSGSRGTPTSASRRSSPRVRSSNGGRRGVQYALLASSACGLVVFAWVVGHYQLVP